MADIYHLQLGSGHCYDVRFRSGRRSAAHFLSLFFFIEFVRQIKVKDVKKITSLHCHRPPCQHQICASCLISTANVQLSKEKRKRQDVLATSIISAGKKKKKNIVTSSGCSQMRYMIRCCICDVEQRHQKQNKKKANMSTGSRKGADHLFLASLPAKVLCAFCLCVCGCTRVCLLSPSLCDVLLQPNESAPVLFFCACACLCYEIYPLITEGESQPLGACCRAG